MEYEFFSPAVIALQQELSTGHHKNLVKVLALCESVEERMSALATYCDIAVDDSFDQKKFDDLCDNCLEILKEKRQPLHETVIVQLPH